MSAGVAPVCKGSRRTGLGSSDGRRARGRLGDERERDGRSRAQETEALAVLRVRSEDLTGRKGRRVTIEFVAEPDTLR